MKELTPNVHEFRTSLAELPYGFYEELQSFKTNIC